MKLGEILFIFICAGILPINGQKSNKTEMNENDQTLRKSLQFAYDGYKMFLNVIRPPTEDSFGDLVNRITGPTSTSMISEIGKKYPEMVTLLVFGGLFVVLMPIVGLLFCICRLNGRCGGEIRAMDPKRARCKRYFYGFCLCLFSVIMLIGLGLTFISNKLTYDLMTDINNKHSFSASLTNAYNELTKEIKAEKSLINQLKDVDKNDFCSKQAGIAESHVTTEHSYFLKDLEDAKLKLGAIISINKTTSGELNSLIEKAKHMHGFITRHNKKATNLYTNKKKKMTDYIETKFRKTCKKFEKFLDSMKYFKSSKEYQIFMNATINAINSRCDVSVHYNEYIYPFKTSFHIIMYTFVGICCFLSLIILFYILGLCFGHCGERPYEDAHLCNRGVGANLMMAGVTFAFLFTPVIMVVEIGMFFPSSLFYLEGCRYLTNSVESKYVNSADSIFVHGFYNKPVNKMFHGLSFFHERAQHFPYNIYDWRSLEFVEDLSKIYQNYDHDFIYPKDEQYAFYTITPFIKNALNKESSGEIVSKLKDLERAMGKAKFDPFQTYYKRKYNEIKNNITVMSMETLFNNYPNKNYVKIYRKSKEYVDILCNFAIDTINGLWIGLGIVLVFTIPGIIFAVKLAGLYRRTERYTSDYEEPDYNSYMGFYTNNTENIPMKRQKSADKNRNNNAKNASKQTNPQYLPVYPYDAYE